MFPIDALSNVVASIDDSSSSSLLSGTIYDSRLARSWAECSSSLLSDAPLGAVVEALSPNTHRSPIRTNSLHARVVGPMLETLVRLTPSDRRFPDRPAELFSVWMEDTQPIASPSGRSARKSIRRYMSTAGAGRKAVDGLITRVDQRVPMAVLVKWATNAVARTKKSYDETALGEAMHLLHRSAYAAGRTVCTILLRPEACLARRADGSVMVERAAAFGLDRPYQDPLYGPSRVLDDALPTEALRARICSVVLPYFFARQWGAGWEPLVPGEVFGPGELGRCHRAGDLRVVLDPDAAIDAWARLGDTFLDMHADLAPLDPARAAARAFGRPVLLGRECAR
jgi:hypothetical protein